MIVHELFNYQTLKIQNFFQDEGRLDKLMCHHEIEKVQFLDHVIIGGVQQHIQLWYFMGEMAD